MLGSTHRGLATLSAVAANPPPDIVLTSLDGEARPLEEWLTTFHLASVVLDPYTNESSWILRTAARILDDFRGSDARVNFVAHLPTRPRRARSSARSPTTSSSSSIPTARFVKGLGLAQLPAFVFLRIDGTVQAAAEGWNADRVARGRRHDRHGHRVDPPDHPDGRRPGPVPRHAGPRLTALERATCRDAWPLPDAVADLPVVEVLDRSGRRAGRHASARVLVAPPGAGKTTVVPLWLLDQPWLGDQTHRDARAAAAGDARRSASDGVAARRARRRHRRLPDPRRAADRPRPRASRS